MDIFGRIAERKIREAMERGEFDHLRNAGRPLDIEDDTFVPEDLRMAYKVLKNAGCIPAELEALKEIVAMKDLLKTIDDDEERIRRIRALNFKIMKYEMTTKRKFSIEHFPEYEDKFHKKVID